MKSHLSGILEDYEDISTILEFAGRSVISIPVIIIHDLVVEELREEYFTVRLIKATGQPPFIVPDPTPLYITILDYDCMLLFSTTLFSYIIFLCDSCVFWSRRSVVHRQ